MIFLYIFEDNFYCLSYNQRYFIVIIFFFINNFVYFQTHNSVYTCFLCKIMLRSMSATIILILSILIFVTYSGDATTIKSECKEGMYYMLMQSR